MSVGYHVYGFGFAATFLKLCMPYLIGTSGDPNLLRIIIQINSKCSIINTTT